MKKLFKEGWKQVQDKPVPENPADPQTSWTKALIWTVSTASLAGLVRLAIRKGLSHKLEANTKSENA